MPLCVIIGAGTGISLAVAERFGREGFTCALVARRAEALDEYVQQLADQSIQARGFVADAGDPESLRAALGKIHDQLGTTDVLVYNASAGQQGTPSTLDPERVVADFRVSTIGALIAAQHVIPAMQQAGTGTILLTGGGLSLNPFPQYASLAIGKAGLRNLAHSLAAELEPAGIHVATITISGFVRPNSPFDPALIAEHYWTLHTQPRDKWQREIILDGK